MADIAPGWLQILLALIAAIAPVVAVLKTASRANEKLAAIKTDVNSNWTKALEEIEAQKLEMKALRMAIANMLRTQSPIQQDIADAAGEAALKK